MTWRHCQEIREEFSFLYKRSSSLETSKGDRIWNAKSTVVAAVSGSFPSDLENPGEGHVEVSRRFVLISAAGLQGRVSSR
ncbi:hypothetical protein APICC_09128 [Apis cerana cerana]|uniref:Uncharacterized protein n=1 Tax=Apis cerana cerana TaxID=94128 RepID=A0A2A3E1D9_APICC|nr:hypothetical protein APICC_09128 [Apis cerana cerana]